MDWYKEIGLWGSIASLISLVVGFFAGGYKMYRTSVKNKIDFSKNKINFFSSFISLFNIVNQNQGDRK